MRIHLILEDCVCTDEDYKNNLKLNGSLFIDRVHVSQGCLSLLDCRLLSLLRF